MKPKKPLGKRELLNIIDSLQSGNKKLTEKNETLTAIVDEIENERQSVKANQVITAFQNLTKTEAEALTETQKWVSVFKVLKALVWRVYE